MINFREEKDIMGAVRVPVNAYYGAQTQRGVETRNVGRQGPRSARGADQIGPDGGMGDRAADNLKSDVLTVPNLLSIFRILLVPVFLWSLLNHKSFEALLVFFVAGITDLLDGLAARLWHQRSKLGVVLDPMGDKLLMATSFVALTLPALARPNRSRSG